MLSFSQVEEGSDDVQRDPVVQALRVSARALERGEQGARASSCRPSSSRARSLDLIECALSEASRACARRRRSRRQRAGRATLIGIGTPALALIRRSKLMPIRESQAARLTLILAPPPLALTTGHSTWTSAGDLHQSLAALGYAYATTRPRPRPRANSARPHQRPWSTDLSRHRRRLAARRMPIVEVQEGARRAPCSLGGLLSGGAAGASSSSPPPPLGPPLLGLLSPAPAPRAASRTRQ